MTFWSMNSKNLNISSMNYGDVEQVAQAIEINGQIIYDSINNIVSLFHKIEGACSYGAAPCFSTKICFRVRYSKLRRSAK